jgi:Mg2+ and Co2+ transporter CorA
MKQSRILIRIRKRRLSNSVDSVDSRWPCVLYAALTDEFTSMCSVIEDTDCHYRDENEPD